MTKYVSGALCLATLLLVACSNDKTASETALDEAEPLETDAVAMVVHKSPTCGCCADWITHMERHGFSADVEHPADLNALKDQLGIAPEYRSCHTAVTEGGYRFEGHVPARYVEQFLADPPEGAIGLAVPGMPAGSPGMEMGGRFDPYEVLLLKKDGSSEVYARVEAPLQQ